MNEPKPIKRSKQLVPLSREHHDTLLFIWKIRKGLKNGTPTAIISRYIIWYWNNFLKEHFIQEEKILLPYLQTDGEMAKRLLKEHDAIRKLILKEMNENSILLLADSLNDHIRFEERKLFPNIEERLSASELNEIFEQLNHQPQCKTQWENEFWISKKDYRLMPLTFSHFFCFYKFDFETSENEC
jgi:hemerythrin-like domain-containing protein